MWLINPVLFSKFSQIICVDAMLSVVILDEFKVSILAAFISRFSMSNSFVLILSAFIATLYKSPVFIILLSILSAFKLNVSKSLPFNDLKINESLFNVEQLMFSVTSTFSDFNEFTFKLSSKSIFPFFTINMLSSFPMIFAVSFISINPVVA